MIQLKVTDNFDAKDLDRAGIRRGFVIPVSGDDRKVLILIDNDGKVIHDDIADKFITMSDEEVFEMLKKCNPEIDEKELKTAMWMCKKLINGYQEKKEDYPSSRKDYLIYETGSVAFDSKPSYSRKYILYRGEGKRYSVPTATERIAVNFYTNGFQEQFVPEDPKVAGPSYY